MSTNFEHTFKRNLLLEKRNNQSLVIQNSCLLKNLSQENPNIFNYHRCSLIVDASENNEPLKVEMYYNNIEDIIEDLETQQSFVQEDKVQSVDYALEFYDENSELQISWKFLNCCTLSFGYRHEGDVYCLDLCIDYLHFTRKDINK